MHPSRCPMVRPNRAVAFLLILVAAPLAASAAAPKRKIDFARDVYPILQRSCFECHGPAKAEGELRLDTRDQLNQGGASGPVVVPGNPGESELARRIALPAGSDEIMPARGQPLTR